MSVRGRAGAGGGGPHQGAPPQTVEAMVVYRLLQLALAGLSFAAPKFSNFPRPLRRSKGYRP